MDKYLYVAMTGASQNALAQKAHANNLANISTNGFQRDLEQARSMPVFGDSFPARAFALTERPATDFSPGALVETGRDLDVEWTADGQRCQPSLAERQAFFVADVQGNGGSRA